MRNQFTESISHLRQNNRGIALLIVLLVTALLIALIFEFSYATRISLNTAVNFRDSQRAYFLARAGINAFVKYGQQLRELTPQGDWGVVPMISEGETQVMIKWEDERGKININTIGDSSLNWVENLFANREVSTDVITKIMDLKKTTSNRKFILLSEIHAVMSDEDYNKVAQFLTADSDGNININTADEVVLHSVLPNNPSAVTSIVSERKSKTISAADVGLGVSSVPYVAKLQKESTYFRVYAYATVGGYTKQVEAALSGSAISYWRAL
jgi:type II secretory pathway component PulK